MSQDTEDEFIETSLPGFSEPDDVTENAPAVWEMRKLKPKHEQICALLAQGMKNVEVASICGVTPQYITMLLNQRLIKAEIARLSMVAGTRLEAMFTKSVDVIGDILVNGSNGEKLKAARLHGELTKRVGRPDPLANTTEAGDDRLEKLAERLVGLMSGARNGNEPVKIYEGEIVRSSPNEQEV